MGHDHLGEECPRSRARNINCARLYPLHRVDCSGQDKEGKNRRNAPYQFTPNRSQFGGVATIAKKQDDLNTTLKRFWDLETMGIMPSRPVMTPDESVA